MKNFIKILLLMVVGFGLGAIAATLKKPRATEPPAVTSAANPETTAKPPAPVVAPGTLPEMRAEKLLEQGVTDPDPTPLSTQLGEGAPVDDDAPAAVIIKGPDMQPVEENKAAEAKISAPADRAPAPAVAATFLLTDHNGVAVTEKSWPGKYLLIFFGFTHCPDICPTALEKFNVTLGKLGTDADKVQVLFITVDPSRDTAEVMKEYVAKFHKSIIGLTGTEDQVKAAIAAFKVYAAKTDGADTTYYMMDHSGFTYFVNPEGEVAQVIKMSDSAAEMVEKIGPSLGHKP